jgi:hypothetical protein
LAFDSPSNNYLLDLHSHPSSLTFIYLSAPLYSLGIYTLLSSILFYSSISIRLLLLSLYYTPSTHSALNHFPQTYTSIHNLLLPTLYPYTYLSLSYYTYYTPSTHAIKTTFLYTYRILFFYLYFYLLSHLF